jgi:hypothetical protein
MDGRKGQGAVVRGKERREKMGRMKIKLLAPLAEILHPPLIYAIFS